MNIATMKWKKRDTLQWDAVVGLWVVINGLIIRITIALTARIIHRLLEGNMKRLTEYTIPETGFSVVSQEKYKKKGKNKGKSKSKELSARIKNRQ